MSEKKYIYLIDEINKKKQNDNPKKINQESKEKNAKKETEEQMICSLQNIFCNGRYRSWVYVNQMQKVPAKKTTAKKMFSK
jgi:hypothetical protein